MSVKSYLVAVCILAVGACVLPAVNASAQAPVPEDAQTTPPPKTVDKTFKLLRDSSTAAADLGVEGAQSEPWVPGVRAGAVELSMSLGFMNLSSTLLAHDQMIYKYTTESTYWGDVVITGQSAFCPVLRVGYTVNPWLTVESYGGVSFSEYSSTIENRRVRDNTQGSLPVDDPPLGEYDAEARSLITLQTGIDLLVYPLNFSGDGSGRWHPYVTGQFGGIWYDMNSDYTDGSAFSGDVAFGGGLRLLSDENVSLRFEAAYHMNTVEWTPAEYFLETDEGTTLVPLNEYPIQEDGTYIEQPITSFESQDLGYLVWSIGFQGTF